MKLFEILIRFRIKFTYSKEQGCYGTPLLILFLICVHIYKEKFIYSSFIIISVLMVLVAEGVHIGLVFGLLPHQLLDHLLPNIQVLLVSMTLNQLPWVSVDLLFAHLLRKKLGQILSVVIILRSGLLLLLHRVKLVEQSLIDARVHLWLHLSWTYLFRHLINSLALLPLKELLNIIYFLLALP